MSKQILARKQQHVLLVILSGAFFIIWSTISYFIEHPTLTIHIEQQKDSTTQQDNNIASTDKTDLIILTQKLQTNPNDIRILLELSKYFIELSNWNQAEYFLLHAITVEPDNLDVLYLLGIAQHNQGNHSNAAKSFKKILMIEPDPSTQYSLGLLYLYYLNIKNEGLYYLQQVIDNPKSMPDMKQATQTLINNINKK